MRHASLHIMAVATLLSMAAIPPLHAEIEAGGAVKADACADDGKTLGVERTVEIDTTGGVTIGGDQKNATNFLKDGEVVLTFDDGPVKSSTRAILKALAEQCTKATFFMVGQMALSDPAMVREVAAGGNTIGTHTWSHKNMRSVNAKTLDQQIESAISTVSKANGAPVAPLFRFPYLSSSRQADAYLKSRDIGAVWVDVDSKDYLTRDPEVVKNRILAQLAKTKKGIILMHDIHAWTAKMLPGLLAELNAKGFKVVHIVAKAPVQTIAAYDAAAEKAITSKTAAKSANPMAERSVVWSIAPPPGSKQKSERGAKKVQAKPASVDGVPAGPSKARAPAKPKDESPLWPFSFFN
jgi:peptidoglycan/xylan/chitin deacetylase (PgdA/CDA1 family)